MYPPSATPVFLFCPSYTHGWLVDSKSRCESRAIIIKGTDLFEQGDCSTVRRSISLLPAAERLAISSSMPLRDPRSSASSSRPRSARSPQIAARSRVEIAHRSRHQGVSPDDPVPLIVRYSTNPCCRRIAVVFEDDDSWP